MSSVVEPILDLGKDLVKGAVNLIKGAVNLVASVTNSLFSWLTPSIPQYDTPGGFDAYNTGTMVNKQSNSAHLPVVYGRRKIGGTRVFVGSGSDNNKYLYVALAICEGEIDHFEKLIVDDENVPIGSLDHGVEREPTNGRYKGRLKVQCFRGTETQTSSSLLGAHSLWGGNHQLRGVAYAALRFEWKKATEDELKDQINSNPYGGIPNVQFVIRGRKVVDLTSITPSTYNTTFYQSTTWSQNPVNCLADYLRNDRFGKAIPNSKFNWDRFKTAAQQCDTAKYSGSDTAHLRCNTTIDTSKKMFDNTKVLLECGRLTLPYQAGQYACSVEGAVESSDLGNLFNITDDMIISEINISGEDKSTKFNTCELTFSSEDKEYEADTVYFQDRTFLTSEDNNEVLKKTHSSPGITSRKRAIDQARLIVNRSRAQKSLSLVCTAETQNIQPADVVKVTHKLTEFPSGSSDYLFNEKLFRVLGCEQNPDQTVELLLVEHTNSIYDVATVSEDQDLNRYHEAKGYVPGGGNQPINPTPQPPSNPGDKVSGPIGNFTVNEERKGGLTLKLDYTNLSSWVDKIMVKWQLPNGTTRAFDISVYGASNKNIVLVWRENQPGTYRLDLEARSSTGLERNILRNKQYTITHGASFANTTSASSSGWSGT
jgi:hypothetical protein